MEGVDRIEWSVLCNQERARREALAFHREPLSQEFREELRSWWKSVAALLERHVRTAAAGETVDPIPLEMLNAIKGFATYLAVGKIPDPVALAASEGAPAAGPSELRDIGFAVAYVRAARGGIDHWGERITVIDRSPVKTIRAAFGVKTSTVQGWMRRIPAAFLGANPINGDILTSLMKQAGERYQINGRSHQAVHARGVRN